MASDSQLQLESIFTSDDNQQVQPVTGESDVREGCYWNFGALSNWGEPKRQSCRQAIGEIISDADGCSHGINSRAFLTVDAGTHEDGLKDPVYMNQYRFENEKTMDDLGVDDIPHPLEDIMNVLPQFHFAGSTAMSHEEGNGSVDVDVIGNPAFPNYEGPMCNIASYYAGSSAAPLGVPSPEHAGDEGLTRQEPEPAAEATAGYSHPHGWFQTTSHYRLGAASSGVGAPPATGAALAPEAPPACLAPGGSGGVFPPAAAVNHTGGTPASMAPPPPPGPPPLADSPVPPPPPAAPNQASASKVPPPPAPARPRHDNSGVHSPAANHTMPQQAPPPVAVPSGAPGLAASSSGHRQPAETPPVVETPAVAQPSAPLLLTLEEAARIRRSIRRGEAIYCTKESMREALARSLNDSVRLQILPHDIPEDVPWRHFVALHTDSDRIVGSGVVRAQVVFQRDIQDTYWLRYPPTRLEQRQLCLDCEFENADGNITGIHLGQA